MSRQDVTITRGFLPTDRYLYDFKLCTTGKGWAQIDTSQDASYYGQWINPVEREILCYCEGDIIRTKCATDEALCSQIAEMKRWNSEQGHRFIGIDPGFNVDLRAALIAVGLGEYFHKSMLVG
jgi:hypothetical protein